MVLLVIERFFAVVKMAILLLAVHFYLATDLVQLLAEAGGGLKHSVLLTCDAGAQVSEVLALGRGLVVVKCLELASKQVAVAVLEAELLGFLGNIKSRFVCGLGLSALVG